MIKTTTLRSILENVIFVWLGLTVILWIGGEALLLPEWVQVIGRSHPLVLHFPIVLILFGLLFFWIPKIDQKPDLKEFGELALLAGINFAGVTVIAGLVLAQEDYEGSALEWHQNAGLIVFLVGILIYFFRNESKKILQASSLVLALGITLTGHWGADLTHGENFLLAPIMKEESELVALSDAEVFRDVVQPILNSKCVSCHKEGKIKGELRLDHIAGIQTGGETGPFVQAGNLENSLMVERINLPLDAKEHMPPKNKLQLTDAEKMILMDWVVSGASFDQKLMDVEPESDLFMLASQTFTTEAAFDFDPADADDITELNNFFRTVEPLYPESPALVVSYFGISSFDPESINELSIVSEQVIQLNMNKMPLNDADLSVIPELVNLQELQLNFTDLNASHLQRIAENKNIKRLSISGNEVDRDGLDALKEMPHLEELYMWQTAISDSEEAELQDALPNTHIDFGFDSEKFIFALNAPQIESEKDMFGDSAGIEISHPIKTVEIRYTLDGTEPDSLSSSVYSGKFWVKKTAEVKTRAFADEWIGSPSSSILVFKSGNPPKDLVLSTQPNPNYFGKGNLTLIDQVKGKNNHTSGEWLGYQQNDAEFEIILAENQNPSEITLSLLYHESAYIFPPTRVEIWTQEAGTWKSVVKDNPKVPTQILPSRFDALTYTLPDTQFEKIKVRMTPIKRLPPWHPGAGSKGWVFIDEVSLLD